MIENGWIKLHRKILNNPISSKPNYAWTWITLLLLSNHEDKEFIFNNEKQTIKRGQLLTGRKSLADQIGVSETSLENILNYFTKVGQIGQQKTNKFRVITVINYEQYQDFGQQKDNKKTTKRHKQEYKEVKNIYISKKYLLNIPEKDLEFISKDIGITKEKILLKGKTLYDWCEAKGKVYKNYKAFLKNCLRGDKEKETPINNSFGGKSYAEIKNDQ
jgi:hypothetical protein